MRRLSLTFLALFWPATALAQSEEIRAGWHPGFTRLVVPIAPGTEWELGKTNRGYALRLPDAVALDPQSVFARIPATRLETLNVNAAGVALGVTCDCHVDAFLWQADRLVIDIKDGPAPNNNPYETVLSVAIPDPEEEADFTLDLLPKPNIDRGRLLERISPLNDVASEPAVNISDLQNVIASNLIRSAEQGLVTLEAPNTLSTLATDDPPSAPALQETESPPQLGLMAQSSIDAGRVGIALDLSSANPASSCWPAEFAAVQDWAAGEGFFEDVSTLHGEIFGEFDKPDQTAITSLAKAYLYYGFGAEAERTIAFGGTLSAELLALSEIAQQIENPIRQSQTLAMQITCDPTVAIWAFLASDDKNISPDVNINDMVRAFRDFPPDLTLHLAPRMAARLLDIGEPDAAELVASQLSAQTAETALISAEIAVNRGEPQDARDRLESAIDAESALLPKALTTLVDLKIGSGEAISSETFSDLETALFTFRDTPDAELLFDALIRALLHDSQFDRAFAALAKHQKDVPAERWTRVKSDALIALAERANDLQFLEVGFSDSAGLAAPFAQNAVADRLITLGFFEKALELLAGGAQGSAMAERRYLRATSYVALDQMESARRELAGLTTPRAQQILQPIMVVQTEQTEPVEDLLGKLDQADTVDLALGESIASLAGETTVPDPFSATPLAESQELISQAEETRKTVESLLGRFPLTNQ